MGLLAGQDIGEEEVRFFVALNLEDFGLRGHAIRWADMTAEGSVCGVVRLLVYWSCSIALLNDDRGRKAPASKKWLAVWPVFRFYSME